MLKKLDLYRQVGIGEYWIANPTNQKILAYTFAEKEIKEYRLFRKDEAFIAHTDSEFRLSEVFS